jgi:hypothetical protein
MAVAPGSGGRPIRSSFLLILTRLSVMNEQFESDGILLEPFSGWSEAHRKIGYWYRDLSLSFALRFV